MQEIPLEIKPKINEFWKNELKSEFEALYFKNLKNFLLSEKKAGMTIYPPGPKYFLLLTVRLLIKLK